MHIHLDYKEVDSVEETWASQSFWATDLCHGQ